MVVTRRRERIDWSLDLERFNEQPWPRVILDRLLEAANVPRGQQIYDKGLPSLEIEFELDDLRLARWNIMDLAQHGPPRD